MIYIKYIKNVLRIQLEFLTIGQYHKNNHKITSGQNFTRMKLHEATFARN